MSTLTISRPGAGFLISLLSYALLLCFMIWGWSEPELERVWRTEQQLEQGLVPSLSDRALLGSYLVNQNDFADTLIPSGKAVFLDSASMQQTTGSRVLLLRAPGPELTVALNGLSDSVQILLSVYSLTSSADWQKEHTVTVPSKIDLPATINFELIELSLSKAHQANWSLSP